MPKQDKCRWGQLKAALEPLADWTRDLVPVPTHSPGGLYRVAKAQGLHVYILKDQENNLYAWRVK